MANYRTNKLLTPYKGYAILRTHSDGEWSYAAHKHHEAETEWWLYVNAASQDPYRELRGNTLKEIKAAIRGDIAAEKWIERANEVMGRM